MTSRSPVPAHSASSPQTEDRLRARLIDFRFEPNLRIDSLVASEGNQVRLIDHRAPVAMVSRYAQQMKAGAVFPAIVVNDRHEIIDGNTRRHAAARAGKDTIAAYVCSGLTDLEARALSVELNQCHGLSMTEEELHAFVKGVVAQGESLDAKAYARMTGVPASTLTRWVQQASFEKRAAQCGIARETESDLSDSCKAALSAVRLTPVLVELATLAVAARMPVTDVRRLVVEVNAAGSEAGALGIVARERELRHDQIRAIANGFVNQRPRRNRATMHVAALLKLEPRDFLDVANDKRTEATARLIELRDRIDAAVGFATRPASDLEVTLRQPSATRPRSEVLEDEGAACA